MGPEPTDDPVQVYIRAMCTAPALTRDEELELSQHLLAHDEHAESSGQRLIEANLGTVVAIAQSYRDSGVHVLDLIQEGNLALLFALRTFADNSDQEFSNHAAACVKNAMSKAITASHPAHD